jgi:hypothetical protein
MDETYLEEIYELNDYHFKHITFLVDNLENNKTIVKRNNIRLLADIADECNRTLPFFKNDRHSTRAVEEIVKSLGNRITQIANEIEKN